MTYTPNRSFLGKVIKRLGSNCARIIHNGRNAVQLHCTIILEYIDENTIELNTNNWQTDISKKMLNKVLPGGYNIYQKKFVWYVTTPSGETIPYQDNMIISL